MTFVKAFLAGFFSTLLLHQGLLALFHAVGATARTAYSMSPTQPFGIPAVVSAAFWGGVWGILLWLAIRPFEGSAVYWLLAIVLGAIAPTLVAFFIVFPLKGQPVADGWRSEMVIGGLLLNAAFGFGVAMGMRLRSGGARPGAVFLERAPENKSRPATSENLKVGGNQDDPDRPPGRSPGPV